MEGKNQSLRLMYGKKKKGRGEKRARSFERLMDITIISIRWEWLWKRKKLVGSSFTSSVIEQLNKCVLFNGIHSFWLFVSSSPIGLSHWTFIKLSYSVDINILRLHYKHIYDSNKSHESGMTKSLLLNYEHRECKVIKRNK